MAEAGLILSVVSLTFQVFSGCVQGYQLLTDAKNMPADCQYLRVRLKTEQYRLLDWAHIVRVEERDDNLLISKASKGMLLDVLEQQQTLLLHFGRLDEKYKKLSKPLLVDAEEANDGSLPEPPAYSPAEPTSPTFSRIDSDFQRRFPQSEALLKKSLAWASKSRGFPRRLKWAAFDQAKMETLVLKLSSFNDYMREMLNTSQLQSLAIKQTRTEFQIMQLNSSIQSLVQIFASTALMAEQKGNRGARSPSTNPVQAFMQARGLEDTDEDVSRYGRPAMQNLAALAQIKALNSAIEDPNLFTDEFASALSLKNTASEIRSVELDRKDIHILDNSSSSQPTSSEATIDSNQRVEAFYQPPNNRKTAVWIEWKTYEPSTFPSSSLSDASTPAEPDPNTHSRVKALAALLKQNAARDPANQFRAPHCLGYFRDYNPTTGEDHYRFGLVFEKPLYLDGCRQLPSRPVSLHSLLSNPNVEMPSLTDRIALMRLLSETIERLHAVNWLHKGLRSSNILFFPTLSSLYTPDDPSSPTTSFSPGGWTTPYTSPYISGFDYSRPAIRDDLTEKPPESAREDIYRHPRVQGSRNRDTASGIPSFRKSYDIYALGIILLEIAYWQPIDGILGIEDLRGAKPSVAFKVRRRLLEGDDDGEGKQGGKGGRKERSKYLRTLRGQLGDRVVDVVRACLEGPGAFGLVGDDGVEVDERSEVGGEVLQRGFYDKVVGVLGALRV